MGHLSYEESKAKALKIILILAAITFGEVIFALLGKGYLIEGFKFPLILVAGVMILVSIVKAYLIVYEFMHMKYEVPGMVKSVLLPVFLLLWGVIAFFSEGNYWKGNRAKSVNAAKTKIEMKEKAGMQGSLYREADTLTKNI